jgi:hypothetical protein
MQLRKTILSLLSGFSRIFHSITPAGTVKPRAKGRVSVAPVFDSCSEDTLFFHFVFALFYSSMKLYFEIQSSLHCALHLMSAKQVLQKNRKMSTNRITQLLLVYLHTETLSLHIYENPKPSYEEGFGFVFVRSLCATNRQALVPIHCGI